TFIAGPAEIEDVAGRHDPVDLLPLEPADVSDPDLVGTGTDREAQRIAEARGDDAVRSGNRAAGQRVAGGGIAVGVDAQELAAEGGPAVSRHPEILAAQRAAKRRGWIRCDAETGRRIATRIGLRIS